MNSTQLIQNLWLQKPYYSINAYLRNQYGQKVYKIALDASLSCPNRDGTIGTGGCIFCSAGGSGDFAIKIATPHQGILPQGIACFEEQLAKHPTSLHIGYFQSFTNTYGDITYLKTIYEEILRYPQIIGISIATRPDCISQQVLDLFQSLRTHFPDKFVWVELGLQTIHESTALYIRRGYPLSCFESCFDLLRKKDIPVIIHVILGLPGESTKKMLETVKYVDKLHPFGVKLQLLHVLEHTDLALDYRQNLFQVLSQDEYISLVADCLTLLSPTITIHRVTGDGPRAITIAPTWSFHKKHVLNSLHKYMKEHHLLQGEKSNKTDIGYTD